MSLQGTVQLRMMRARNKVTDIKNRLRSRTGFSGQMRTGRIRSKIRRRT